MTDTAGSEIDTAPMPSFASSAVEAPTSPAIGGLIRQRLVELADEARVLVVLSPAGTGKTTLLSQLAARWPDRQAWVGLDGFDGTGADLARGLCRSSSGAVELGDDGSPLRDDTPTLLIFDDLHELAGRNHRGPDDPMLLIGQLARRLPPTWRLVLAGRSGEGLGLAPLQLAEGTITLTADDLRFRMWEIDELFARHYEQPLSVSELAPLARNTEGWAAALHLFHLAARRSPSRRAQLIAEIRTQSVVLRRYLVDQVLGALDDEEIFLVSQVAVLDLIRPELVTGLIGRRGIELVDRLHQLGLLSTSGIPGEFHLHGLLRDQLLDLFSSRAGHGGLLDLYRRGGAVLERHGFQGQAVRAYLRAGHLADAHRVAADAAVALAPIDISDDIGGDPWRLWAQGTVELYRGNTTAALTLLERSERRFAAPPASLRTMIAELASWSSPPPVPEPAHPWGCLRRWLAGDDSAAVGLWNDTGPAGAIHALVEQALEGQWGVPGHLGGGDRLTQAVIRLSDALLRILAGQPADEPLAEVELLIQSGVEYPALERLFAALSAPRSCAERGDQRWVTVLRQLRTQAEAQGDTCTPPLFDVLDVLGRDDTAVRRALVGSGMRRLAQLIDSGRPALEILPSRGATDGGTPRRSAAAPVPGDPTDGVPTGQEPSPAEPAPEHYITLTGPFRIGGLDETDADQPLRPQHLALLQLLALNAARWLERDQLLRWFWPDVEEEPALRRLATALSAIRKALDGRASESSIERRGNLYRLDPAGGTSDLADLIGRLRSAELELASDAGRGLDVVEECLRVQRGPLLPSAEAAAWLDEARWHLEGRWERTLQALFSSEDPAQAPRILELLPQLVQLAPHSDTVWQGAVRVAEGAGSPLMAKRLRQRYERLLEEE